MIPAEKVRPDLQSLPLVFHKLFFSLYAMLFSSWRYWSQLLALGARALPLPLILARLNSRCLRLNHPRSGVNCPTRRQNSNLRDSGRHGVLVSRIVDVNPHRAGENNLVDLADGDSCCLLNREHLVLIDATDIADS